jgi:hypothetical protein
MIAVGEAKVVLQRGFAVQKGCWVQKKVLWEELG